MVDNTGKTPAERQESLNRAKFWADVIRSWDGASAEQLRQAMEEFDDAVEVAGLVEGTPLMDDLNGGIPQPWKIPEEINDACCVIAVDKRGFVLCGRGSGQYKVRPLSYFLHPDLPARMKGEPDAWADCERLTEEELRARATAHNQVDRSSIKP